MLTVYVRTSQDRLEIGRGEMRAQFELQDSDWVPAWFWLGDRRMLRFKNHQWLALGHLRPKAAEWEIIEDSADRAEVQFSGEESYFGVPVSWSVTIAVEDASPGFTVTTEIRPSQTIELVECFSRFETPDDYDGHEESLCVVGQNPVALRRGEHLVTPRIESGGQVLSSAGTWGACRAGPTRTPTCCLRLKPAGGGEESYLTFLGHWDACCFKSICVVPTAPEHDLRAYEILVGTLDWRASHRREPNVFFEAGRRYQQRLSFSFSSETPGGTLDRWLFGAFERSLRHFFPAEPILETDQRARQSGVSMKEANEWLINLIGGDGVPGLYSAEGGLVNYTEGSCPGAGHYSIDSLAAWLGPLGYQAYTTRREDLQNVCDRLAERIASVEERPYPTRWTIGPTFHELLPILRYLVCYPNDKLKGVVRRSLGRLLEAFPPESGELPDVDYGSEAFHAQAYLLAAQISGDTRLREAGFTVLERINAAGHDCFWRFGCAGGWRDDAAGGQARPLGYGHAIMSNLVAYQQTRDEKYMEAAGMFARLLVSLAFATYNDSTDPDFDARGFANGAISGWDRMRECSPVETADSLRCVAYWLAYRPEQPVGYYDLFWYFSRNFCGVFPAARGGRTGLTVDGEIVTHKNDDLPTAIAYRRFSYIAYEEPVRLLRQSPRASLEALQNYLTFGGGLASCDNDRLLVLVPRAGGYDLSERISRVVHVYNPGEIVETTRVSIHHLHPRSQYDIIKGNRRVAKNVPGDKLSKIEVEVRPRHVVVFEVTPVRRPSTHA